MIKLSRMSDYAVVVLEALSRREGEGQSASQIAASVKLPEPTVAKVLKQMAAGGLVTSQRGVNGGYTIARAPNEISVFDIVSVIEGRLSLTACGFGLFFAPTSRLLIGQAPRDRAAAAGGLLSTSRLLGQTMAAVVVGILLASGAGLGPTPLFVACALAVIAALCSMARFWSVTRAGGTMATLRQT